MGIAALYSRPEITTTSKSLFEQNQRIAASPALINTAYERSVRGLRRDFVKEMSTRTAPHKRPTEWQTPKQRRWWWAVGVHLLNRLHPSKGWRTDIQTTTLGGVFRYWNVVPTWIFVQGERMQRMHRYSWRTIQTVAPKYASLASVRLAEIWHTITDPRAGVR